MSGKLPVLLLEQTDAGESQANVKGEKAVAHIATMAVRTNRMKSPA
jgi:hypothetical protein